jgi:hypothetical protein
MLDRQWMQRELNEARAARQDAEAANADVEEMLWELQHLEPRRLIFSIAGFEQDLDQPATAH